MTCLFAQITEPGSHICSLPNHREVEPLVRADIAVKDRTRCQTNCTFDRWCARVAGQGREKGHNGTRTFHGVCPSAVRVRVGWENSQNRIADEFQNLATVFMNNARYSIKKQIQQVDLSTARQLFFQLGGAAQVAEHDGRVNFIAVATPDFTAKHPRARPFANLGFQHGLRVFAL